MSYRNKLPKKSCVIRDYCIPFKLSDETLCDISNRLLNAINQGLSKDTRDQATVKSIITYVQDLPTGNETGRYLAIDLGGANFRILLVTLGNEKSFKMDSRVYAFPEEKMNGTADEFFDYVAECVGMFKTAVKLENEDLPLGFCFSFPVELKSLTSGFLLRWAKGVHIEEAIGKDVVEMLQQALDKRQLKVKIKALVNDTVGCLMSCAWKNQNCRMGVIIGTGTNACYMERIENVELFEDKSKPFMIINTEWGNFGSDGNLNDILTECDHQLDSISIRSGSEIFEKLVSVMYVCELIRLSVIKCTEKKYLFTGEITEKMKQKGSFLPDFMYDIEKDTNLLKTMSIFENDFKVHTVNQMDCVNVKHIVKMICQRSANLAAAAISTLINKMNISPISVAIDGSMYRYHPKYADMLEKKVRCMINPKIEFQIMLSQDGSGRGTALVAASVQK